jgi:hypothetical protein
VSRGARGESDGRPARRIRIGGQRGDLLTYGLGVGVEKFIKDLIGGASQGGQRFDGQRQRIGAIHHTLVAQDDRRCARLHVRHRHAEDLLRRLHGIDVDRTGHFHLFRQAGEDGTVAAAGMNVEADHGDFEHKAGWAAQRCDRPRPGRAHHGRPRDGIGHYVAVGGDTGGVHHHKFTDAVAVGVGLEAVVDDNLPWLHPAGKAGGGDASQGQGDGQLRRDHLCAQEGDTHSFPVDVVLRRHFGLG